MEQIKLLRPWDLKIPQQTQFAKCAASMFRISIRLLKQRGSDCQIPAAFADEEFLSVILSNYTVLNYESLDYESRCRVLFTKCWDHLMAHPNELTFYVRYYYSISFQKYAYTEHMARYKNLFEKMKTAFPDSVDVQRCCTTSSTPCSVRRWNNRTPRWITALRVF